MSSLSKPIKQLTDLELEEAVNILEMDIRWNRNHAYALSGARSRRLMKEVKHKEELLRNLWTEREQRIVNGKYHPFY